MQKLLIAEKSEIFADLLEKAFRDQYAVYRCSTGPETLELLQFLRPQALIIDLHLPYLDGLEVLRRSAYRPPAILALATTISPYVQQSALEVDVDFIAIIPCTIPSIVSHVAEITRMAKAGKQIRTSQQLTEEHLLRLGLQPHRAGFGQLRVGIPLFAQNENQHLKKELYAAIAECCGNDNPEQVERSIRQVIKEAWQRGDLKIWQEYFPRQIKAPTNKVFITALAQLLRRSSPDRIW